MDLDLRDLRYFRTIAELGHLSRAGSALGRSQPALTKCVRRLEAALGAELFVRKGRGIALTPVGEMLLQQSRRLLSSADATFREVQGFARGEAGRVRLGCGPISAEHLLPGICNLVLAKAEGVTLEINIAMNYVLREQLRRGEIELITGMIQEPDDEFVTMPLIEDVVVVAAGRSHPIFKTAKPRIEDLVKYEWVLPVQQVASRRWLDRTFEAHGLPLPHAQIEANSIPMPQQMIANTGLLCFVSRHTLARRPASPLKEVPLDILTLIRRAGLTFPAGHLAPPVKRVIDLLSENLDWVAAGAAPG
jgi:DNA-binding transcriptional LysR family regulator